jgi:hypothetical protein
VWERIKFGDFIPHFGHARVAPCGINLSKWRSFLQSVEEAEKIAVKSNPKGGSDAIAKVVVCDKS